MKTLNKIVTPAIFIFGLFSMSSHAVSIDKSVDNIEIPATVVKFADLDLTTQGGAKTLHKRITKAADKVCMSNRIQSKVLKSVDAKKCVEESIERAVTEINLELLTSYHQAS